MILIFDIDDTIYDLMEPFEKAHKEIFETRTDMPCVTLFMNSRIYSDEILEKEKQGLIPSKDCFFLRIQRTYQDAGIVVSREEGNEFERIYRSAQKVIHVNPDMEDILNCGKELKIPMGIVSNGNHKGQYAKIDALNLKRWFGEEHIFISGDVGWHKPDLRIFQAVEQAFHAEPEEIWYLGDTYEVDVTGGRNAGWNVIWFNHRNRECPEERNSATMEVRTGEELKKAVMDLLQKKDNKK